MDIQECVSKFKSAFWAAVMEKKKNLLDIGEVEKDPKEEDVKAHSHNQHQMKDRERDRVFHSSHQTFRRKALSIRF